MSLEKSTPYRNAWYRDLLEKEAELKQYTDEKVAQAIELPEVTSEDNGDLLAADDGSWVKSDKLKTIMNAGVEQVGKIPMVGVTGDWTLADYPSNELPSVSSADNGKVAGVVDGNWNTMDIPNELPAVTGADDGKMLGVTNGSWGIVDLSSDTVYYKLTNQSGNTRYLDNNKTIGDIQTDISNGKNVIITDSNGTTFWRYSMKLGNGALVFFNTHIQSSIGRSTFLETSTNSSSNILTFYAKILVPVPTASGKTLRSTTNNWLEADFPTELPTVSASDDGKVLTVVDGAWRKASPNTLKSLQFVNGQALSDDDYASIKANTDVRGIYSDSSKFIIFELSSCNFLQTEFEFVNYAEGLKATIDATKVVTIASI